MAGVKLDSIKLDDVKLDSYLSAYTDFNDWLIRERYKRLKHFFTGTNCLELGPAEGEGTKYLLDNFERVVSVDGSGEAVELLRKQFKSDKFSAVHSYFEILDLNDEKFDTVVLAHILEHVDDPVIVLKQAKKFLKNDGIMIIDVPNGNSLHRQVGVHMGLLNQTTDLNEADLSIGHQRVYLPETFKTDIKKAGLKIKKFGGMFVKVLSNAQTESVFSNEQLNALFKVGEANPSIAAEIYAIATL